jgi:hypothetical protein
MPEAAHHVSVVQFRVALSLKPFASTHLINYFGV